MKGSLRYILLPFSALYGLTVYIRNKLFDWNVLKTSCFTIPVISVGNITAGGTGKTPHVEYLIKLLQDNHHPAILSRGYKRKTKGFILAKDKPSPLDVGDEPAQIKCKFPLLTIAVDANRTRGIRKICEAKKKTDLIILDDAFQHRYVKPGLSIMLSDFNNPVWKDCLLPAGRLREPLSSIKRADIIIITKAPESLSEKEKTAISGSFKLRPYQELFFTGVKSGKPLPVFGTSRSWDFYSPEKRNSEILLITGIAHPGNVKHFAEVYSPSVHHMIYPDHHSFSLNDIRKIRKKFTSLTSTNKLMLTTEKDAVRLRLFWKELQEIQQFIFYIPIEVFFHEPGGAKFNQKIIDYVEKNN